MRKEWSGALHNTRVTAATWAGRYDDFRELCDECDKAFVAAANGYKRFKEMFVDLLRRPGLPRTGNRGEALRLLLNKARSRDVMCHVKIGCLHHDAGTAVLNKTAQL